MKLDFFCIIALTKWKAFASVAHGLISGQILLVAVHCTEHDDSVIILDWFDSVPLDSASPYCRLPHCILWPRCLGYVWSASHFPACRCWPANGNILLRGQCVSVHNGPHMERHHRFFYRWWCDGIFQQKTFCIIFFRWLRCRFYSLCECRWDLYDVEQKVKRTKKTWRSLLWCLNKYDQGHQFVFE